MTATLSSHRPDISTSKKTMILDPIEHIEEQAIRSCLEWEKLQVARKMLNNSLYGSYVLDPNKVFSLIL